MSEGLSPLQVTSAAAQLWADVTRSCLPQRWGRESRPAKRSVGPFSPRPPTGRPAVAAAPDPGLCVCVGGGGGVRRRHYSPDSPLARGEAGPGGGRLLFIPLPRPLAGAEHRRGREHRLGGTGVQPRPRRLVPFAGARSRPLPLASHPFPFLPLLFRFHPTPTPL